MKLSEFTYDLPEELIAQHPIEKRDESRLMVLDRISGQAEHKKFKNIIEYLNQGDCLVVNNTKVIPARLRGRKISAESSPVSTGAYVEFLLLKDLGQDKWEVMVRPGKKLLCGTKAIFGAGILEAEILEKKEDGNRVVKFKYDGIFNEILDKIGCQPLPPYIKEELKEKDRYQTVYALNPGSAAAPTAGLHFTKELLEEIKHKGVKIANVTLNVGIGTFRPVKVDNIEEHHMHSEYFEIDKRNAEIINKAKTSGGKIVAVGTTSCRVLESATDENGIIHPMKKDTNIFIYGDYRFKMIDALITNFHLPESTLLMLISALAGRENILNAYSIAVQEKYRFFSFGDAMFIH